MMPDTTTDYGYVARKSGLAQRWPLILAGLFFVYAMSLLASMIYSQDMLETAVARRLIADGDRRAMALASHLESRRDDVTEMAERYEIEAYLANKALGMSEKYGLIANLIAIDDYFKRKIEQKRTKKDLTYDRISFFDESGHPLSEGAPDTSPVPVEALRSGTPQMRVDPATQQIHFAAPVFYKGEFRGAIVATGSALQITGFLFNGNDRNAYREFLLTASGEVLSGLFDRLEIDQQSADSLLADPVRTLQPVASRPALRAVLGDALTLRNEIRSTTLSFITVIDRTELSGHKASPILLVTIGLLPLVLILATFAFERQRTRSLQLSLDNIKLSEDIARRQLVEAALLSKNVELEKISEELRDTAQRAEAANQAKSAFLATMSHEIRTPMNGILGTAQILAARDLSEAEYKECVRVLLDSGQSLLMLLNDILDLAKVEAGKLEIRPSPASAGELVRECVGLFSEPAQSKSLSIGSECHIAGQATYLLDRVRVRQMLTNLIGNAVKFTRNGEIRVEVRELGDHVSPSGRMLEFSVTDTGIGISPEKQRTLFENFTQVDNSSTRNYGGTGLGLAIVKNLAQLMGGSVGLSSEEGKGSRFWFRVPAHPVAQTADTHAQSSGTASALKPSHVLVAEDNRANQRIIETILRKQGHTVRLVENGQLAIDTLAGGEAFDLILMDMRMPVLDGVQATMKIRELEAVRGRPRCPIVAMTANAYNEDRERCLKAGMDDFISKPIMMDELRRVLATFLAAREAPRPAEAAAKPTRSVDIPVVEEILSRLLPELDRHLFDSIARFDELKAAVADTDLAPVVAAIDAEAPSVDFANRARRLRELASAMNWSV